MADDKNNQASQSSDNSGSSGNQSSSGNEGQASESNPSWPSVNTSESISAIRNDINKSGDSKPITTKES